jgi:hypothetical protein
VRVNPDKAGPWYDGKKLDEHAGLRDNYPRYKGYDGKACAKAFKKYYHLDVFRNKEDQVWTYNQPNRNKTFEAKLKNTYNRRMGAEDSDKNEKYCKAVGMGINHFEKALSKGRHEYYIESINRLHMKSFVCNDPYRGAGTAYQRFKITQWKDDPALVGDMKTQKLFAKRAAHLKKENNETTARTFAKDRAKQFGRASTLKMNGMDGDNDASKD